MDIDLATNAVIEEHLQVEGTDDFCRDAYGSCTREIVSGDGSAYLKQENFADFVEQEHDDVCCATLMVSVQFC